MPVDPDEPTRVVRERATVPPPVPEAVPRVAAPVGVVDPAWAARAEDRLRSLRTMLAVMSVLTLAALGLAIWALTENDEESTQGASRGRVAALSERVERLEDRPARTTPSGSQASASDLRALQEDVDELQAQVEEGAAQSEEDPDAASAESVTALGTRVDELAQQVDDLRTAAAQGGGTEETP